MAEHVGSVYVNVLPDADGFWREFQRRTDPGASTTGWATGRPLGQGLGDSAGAEARRRIELLLRNMQGSATVRVDTAKSERSVNALRTALLLLGPSVFPLAGAAAAGGAALAAMGAAGILAVKGVKTEMAAGTPTGVAYAQALATAQDVLGRLEKTAAQGALSGFQRSVGSLNGDMPFLNATMRQSSEILGDVVAKLTHGVAGGLENFGPIIGKVEGLVDRLAGRFETWATGPGGAKFAQTLSQDLDTVVPVLSDLATTATHLIAAFAPSGTGGLHEIDMFSQIVNALPVDVLKAGTTAFIAFKAAAATSAGIATATAALEKFAAAETTAAAAAGSAGLAGTARAAAGGLAVLTSRIAPYAAAWVGAAFATNAAASATDNLYGSTSRAEESLYSITHALSDVFNPSRWSSIASDFTGPAKAANALRSLTADFEMFTSKFQAHPINLFDSTQQQGLVKQVQDLNAQIAYAEAHLRVAGGAGAGFAQGVGPTKQIQDLQALRDQLARTQAMIDAQSAAEENYASAVNKANSAVFGALHAQQAQSSSISTASAAYDDITAALQKRIDAEKVFLPVAKDHGVVVNGVAYSEKAVSQALDEAGGNYNTAVGILQGHRDALDADTLAMNRAQFEQSNLNDAVAGAESKYKLTAQQVDLYSSAMGITADAVRSGKVGLDAYYRVIGEGKSIVDTANTSMLGFVNAIQQFNQSNKTGADTAALIGQTLKAYNGDALSYAGSLAATTSAIDTLTGAFASQRQQLAQQSADQAKAAAAVDSAAGRQTAAQARIAAAQARLNQVRGNSKATTAQIKSAEAGLASAQASAASAATRYGNAQATAGKQAALAYSDTERAAITFTGSGAKLAASINTQAKGAADLVQQLQSLQDAAMNAAEATYQHEKSLHMASAADDAYNIYLTDTQGALIKQAGQLGLTTAQATALAKTYFGMPADVKTKIEQLGTDKAQATLGAILADLDKLSGGHHFDLYANAADVFNTFRLIGEDFDALQNHVNAIVIHSIGGGWQGTGFAEGGLITGPGSGTSDSILAKVSNGEFVSTARATSRHYAELMAWNRESGASPRGYAQGGPVQPLIGPPVTVNITQQFAQTAAERASVSGPDAIRRAAETNWGLYF